MGPRLSKALSSDYSSPRPSLCLVHVYSDTERYLSLLSLMTLPANDAFSLSHDSTRPPYSLSLRPTSPKIPFVTSHTRTPLQTYNIPPRKTVRPRRSMNGHADVRAEYETPQIPTAEEAAREAARVDISCKASATVVAAAEAKSPPTPPIDWEIPRKILHSSIGQFFSSIPGAPLTRVAPYRIFHAVSVPRSWLITRRRHSPRYGLGSDSPC